VVSSTPYHTNEIKDDISLEHTAAGGSSGPVQGWCISYCELFRNVAVAAPEQAPFSGAERSTGSSAPSGAAIAHPHQLEIEHELTVSPHSGHGPLA
jgi:hypothetical protein